MFGRITPVVKTLLLINILIFAVQELLNLPLADWFGFRYVDSPHFQPYQAFTYMFVHSDFWHIFSNMLALFIFGPMLEVYFGPNRFTVFYLATGIGAGFLFSLVNYYEMSVLISQADLFYASPNPDEFLRFVREHVPQSNITPALYEFMHNTYPASPENIGYMSEAKSFIQELVAVKGDIPMVGASGAVFGILFAFGWLFPNIELMLLFPPIPIKAKYFVTLYAAYEIYSMLNARADDNVAHLAHIGGMLFAFILIKLWNIRSQNF